MPLIAKLIYPKYNKKYNERGKLFYGTPGRKKGNFEWKMGKSEFDYGLGKIVEGYSAEMCARKILPSGGSRVHGHGSEDPHRELLSNIPYKGLFI